MELKTCQQFIAFVDYGIKSLYFGWADYFEITFGRNRHLLKVLLKNDNFYVYFKHQPYCIYPLTIIGIELLKREINTLSFKYFGWDDCIISFKKNIRKELRKYE